MNPAKITKMDEEVQKWSRKDPMAIKKGMLLPRKLAFLFLSLRLFCYYFPRNQLSRFSNFSDTLELLERGEMVKDYNANSTSSAVTNGAESEDEEDPRTPTSVSSQGSQGYDSAGSDFVDIEGFTTSMPDSSLPELNLQVGQ